MYCQKSIHIGSIGPLTVVLRYAHLRRFGVEYNSCNCAVWTLHEGPGAWSGPASCLIPALIGVKLKL